MRADTGAPDRTAAREGMRPEARSDTRAIDAPAADARRPDLSMTPPPVDARAAGGREAGPWCGMPVAAFDASPVAGNTCGVDNALVTDGKVAGLDYITSLGQLDGEWAAGCVGVDFGVARWLVAVVVRAGASTDACGGDCCCGYCGTGHQMLLFDGTSMGAYTYDTEVALSSSALTDYCIPLDKKTRYIVVCRGGGGPARDDIVVDSIGCGACQ